MVNKGYITTRYGRAAAVFLQIAAGLDEAAGAPLREFVRRDLTALWTHAWDGEAGVFHSVLNDGTRLSPDDVDDVGYCPPAKLGEVPANGLMLLACSRAYRVLGDAAFSDMAFELAAGRAGRGDVVPAFVPSQAPFDPKILARQRGLG